MNAMERSFTDVFTDAQVTALVGEAAAAYAGSRQVLIEGYRVNGAQLLSPTRYRYARTGPELDGHKSGALARLVREHFGARLTAVTSSYNFYGVGDHIGIHRDAPDCRYAALIPLSRDLGPLDLYPHLAGCDGGELLKRIDNGAAGAPVRLPIPYGGVVVIQGSVLPHARPPATLPCAVATVCFG
ncbi:hypothetical protein ACFFMN_28720 [Planobispora siamensis]|uniref:Uncharacterized protein n=1 Tax=Planobispora siamensis TaxID=936338 RepID=A0A8J3SRL9_9ACTN|nr:hypothetical protein [Planobispora siamensis]GIH97450.1 hypothetical protein Psi01_80800 [Planobispora siamensis]